jgi:hypothetical protein
MNFTELSKKLTRELETTEKKNNGIYFTPQTIINRIIKKVKEMKLKKQIKILEPSCGSGEFLNILNSEYKKANITGIEFNKKIYDEISQVYKSSNIKIIEGDYIQQSNGVQYNLIIGNPPYYVMKNKDVPDEYKEYIVGRANIFILFIIKSINLLVEKGIMAFVLPISFLNCHYYDKVRKLINETCKILEIELCNKDKFLGTEQKTLSFIIQKVEHDNSSYVLIKEGFTIFNTKPGIEKLKELYTSSKSLNEMGFNVRVGKVVWNQVKDKLTNDETKTRLIYNSDIVDNKLTIKQYKNEAKKNFINKEGKTNPLLVVNRGYGKGKYKFSYCLINMEKEYLIENHLICIESKEDMTKNMLLEKYRIIIESLENNKTIEFVKLYFGNNAINTTELNYMLPIFI